jgi:heme A synthase
MHKTTTIAAGGGAGAGVLARLRAALEFRYFALFTVVATYGLIVLGGTVRATNSGTACPDWPLCYGDVVPPFDTKVMIEYSHRVVASVVGFLILGTVFWLWRRRPQDRLVRAAGPLTLVLLGAQVIAGGVTVNTETAATVVAIHLSIALTLLAALIFNAGSAWAPATAQASSRRLPVLLVAAALCVLALIITGAFVSQEGAGLAYPDWPLFDGKLTWAAGKVGELHYLHRLTAVLAGVMIGAAVWRVLRREDSRALLVGAAAALVLYVAQVFAGAANIWLDLPTGLRIVHMALASALWAVLVFTIVWSFLQSRSAAGARA